MLVRPRTEDDIDALVAIAAATQTDSGYPHPVVTDLRSFVTSPRSSLAAWVAEDDGVIVGHGALHSKGSTEMTAVVRAAVGEDVPFGVVSRLFVSPSVRRGGAGRLLLARATEEAVARSLVPVLDVSIHFGPANALYAACGYEQIGTAAVPISADVIFEENVYRYVPD
jgi:GNAT superfamily N-acetyltransferase